MALLSGGAALVTLVGSAAPGLAQQSTSVTIGGNVTTQQTFTLPDLQALTPVVTENVNFLMGSTPTTRTFTGIPLFNLINDVVGLRTTPGVNNDALRNVVMASATDGYVQVYAYGEIHPNFGGNAPAFNNTAVPGPELLAYENAPGTPLGSDGFARTTAPGDARGGRYVSNVDRISVLHAPRMTGTFAGGVSNSFTVTGQVNTTPTFTAASLAAMTGVTTVTPLTPSGGITSFTGIPLYNVLQSAGIITNPAVNNHLNRMFVIATASDGYQATIAVGEIDPRFGANTANPIIVAFAANGAPLTDSGSTRLITPDDDRHGRWVSNLINLELFDVSYWKVLGGSVLDMNAFNYRTLGFNLAGGTLASTNGSATLTSDSYTFNGGVIDAAVTLAGVGSATQASGTTVLNGNHSYTGATVVNGGTLIVNGSIASSSSLTVDTGGVIGGNGVVPTTTISAGTLSPGNSVGTLTVAGNLTMSTAASYVVEVAGAAADRTNVSGTSALAGTVQVSVLSSPLNNTYTILSSTGARSGTFSGVTSTSPNYSVNLSYSGNNVLLNFTAGLGSDSGLGSNQQAVAGVINNFFNGGGTLPAGFGAVLNQTGAALGGTLGQLSGENAAGIQTSSFMSTGMFLNSMLDPFVIGREGGGFEAAMAYAPEARSRRRIAAEEAFATAIPVKAPLRPAFERRWNVWGTTFGGRSRLDGDPATGSNDLSATVGGFAIGADYRISPHTILGLATAIGETHWSSFGNGRADVAQIGGYATTRWESIYLSAAVAGAWYRVATDRMLNIAGTDRLEADFDANSIGARFEGGRRFAYGGVGVTPYAAVQLQSVHTPAYAEQATAGSNQFALSYAAQTTTDTRSELGAWFDTRNTLANGSALLLRARAAWVHDYNPGSRVQATFQTLPGASFTTDGAPAPRDAALVSAVGELRLVNVALIGKLDGEFSDRGHTIAGSGTLRYSW